MHKYQRRGEPLKKNCLWCGSEMVRPYKMTLNKWDDSKYCSQKCNGESKRGTKIPHKPMTLTIDQRNARRDRMRGKKYALGYRHTDDAKKRMSVSRMGEKHWDWRDDKASYSAFHKWLVSNFGPALKCENKNCLGTSTMFHYALLHHKSHSHNRDNYVQLCASCHKFYDVGFRMRIEL